MCWPGPSFVSLTVSKMSALERRVTVTLILLPLLAFSLSRCQDSCLVPEADRENCVASSCPTCERAPATCTFSNSSTLEECSVNDNSTCLPQSCDECDQCVATFFTADGDYFLRSECFVIQHNEACEILNRNCLLEFFGNPGVYSCRCNGENCSVHGRFVEEAPISTTSVDPPVTHTTTSPVPPSTPSPTDTLPTDAARAPLTASLLAMIVVIAVILVLVVVSIVAICGVVYAKRHLRSRPRPRQTPTNENGGHYDNQDIPWVLLEMIGRGRFGTVYKARSRSTDQLVAVKIFSYNSRQSWETERAANVMESTAHPNILEYVGSESRGSKHEMQLYMASCYHPLGSLNQFLSRQPVSWEQACRMVYSIASGLAHLHSEHYTNSAGIVAEKYAMAHRDIKSANVLVRDMSGECVIADLGLSFILDPAADPKQLANAGQVGTFRYMAPEAMDARINLRNQQCFKQIDVYAFSLVIWEILWRCTAMIQPDEDIPSYQLPFSDLISERPTLEEMKDVVVTRRLRPTIPASWRSHNVMERLVETMQESWDQDPEARLTAKNVVMRMEDILDQKLLEQSRDSREMDADLETHLMSQQRASVSGYDSDEVFPDSSAMGMGTGGLDQGGGSEEGGRGRLPDLEGSMPPPYSELPAVPELSGGLGSRPRTYFQSSMPHISNGEGGGGRYGYTRPPSEYTRNRRYRNSAILEGERGVEGRNSVSVRNSLILGGTRMTFEPVLSGSQSTTGIGSPTETSTPVPPPRPSQTSTFQTPRPPDISTFQQPPNSLETPGPAPGPPGTGPPQIPSEPGDSEAGNGHVTCSPAAPSSLHRENGMALLSDHTPNLTTVANQTTAV